jgi:hypothetical protein
MVILKSFSVFDQRTVGGYRFASLQNFYMRLHVDLVLKLGFSNIFGFASYVLFGFGFFERLHTTAFDKLMPWLQAVKHRTRRRNFLVGRILSITHIRNIKGIDPACMNVKRLNNQLPTPPSPPSSTSYIKPRILSYPPVAALV